MSHTFALVLPEVCGQCPVWLFSVLPDVMFPGTLIGYYYYYYYRTNVCGL